MCSRAELQRRAPSSTRPCSPFRASQTLGQATPIQRPQRATDPAPWPRVPGGTGSRSRLLPTVPTHTQSAHASARAELDGGQACALPGPPAAPPRPERPTARWGRHAWPQARFRSRLAMKRGCAPLLPWLRQRDASAKGWHPTRRPDGAGPRPGSARPPTTSATDLVALDCVGAFCKSHTMTKPFKSDNA